MEPRGPLLVDQLRYMADEYPDTEAYIVHSELARLAITFREWDARSNQVARWLVDRGIGKGERVALHVPSERCLEWITTYAGIHKAGAVMVPVNTRLSKDEVLAILRHAEPRALVTATELGDVAQAIQRSLALESVIAVGAVEVAHTEWSALAELDDDDIQIPVDLDDMADIMYTSGTTGLPKGVLVRHRNVAMIPNNRPVWSGGGWLHGAPLFTFAGMSFVYNPMKMGLAGWYLPKFDVDSWFDIVERDRPVMCMLVPAMAELLVASPRFAQADLSSFVGVSIGSAPLAPATLQTLQDKMPKASVTNSYGLTEAGPAYIVMPKEEARNRIGSVGKPIPPMEVKIVDPELGTTVAANATGELLVRLPGQRREYYRDDEATSATWTDDGWLRTGDLAHLDEDGFVYISGRIKDMIIRGGNNIYATDVEAVILEHRAIREAAVVGIPHPVLGEDVGAFVVTRPEATCDEAELTTHCADRLADYKRPRRIWFVDELPRNATGKVMKQQLRERAATHLGANAAAS